MNNCVRIVEDERGSLIAFDNIEDFQLKRLFFIECKKGVWRGDHYHKKVTQKIYVVDGNVEYILESEEKTLTGFLGKGQSILHNTGYKFKFRSITETSKIVVLCDNNFDHKDYYNNWNSGDEL